MTDAATTLRTVIHIGGWLADHDKPVQRPEVIAQLVDEVLAGAVVSAGWGSALPALLSEYQAPMSGEVADARCRELRELAR